MSSPESPTGQAEYWNRNLDPQNLGKAFEVGRFRWDDEIAFYKTPDQLFALEQFEPIEAKRVLDVGAGIGINALYLASRGATVVAIDIAQDRLTTLQHLHQRLQPTAPGKILAVKCSVEALPFRDGCFDHQYSKSVLIHTQLDRAIPELHRTLRPHGRAVFIEPLTGNPLVNLYRNTLAPKVWKEITHYFREEDITRFASVFRLREVRHYYLLSFLAFAWQFGVRNRWLFRASLHVLCGVDKLLARAIDLPRRAWFAAICVEKEV